MFRNLCTGVLLGGHRVYHGEHLCGQFGAVPVR